MLVSHLRKLGWPGVCDEGAALLPGGACSPPDAAAVGGVGCGGADICMKVVDSAAMAGRVEGVNLGWVMVRWSAFRPGGGKSVVRR